MVTLQSMLRNNNQNKGGSDTTFDTLKINQSYSTSAKSLKNTKSASSPTVLSQLEIDVAKCSPEVVQELTFLLTEVLHYPSAVDSDIHSRANRLGLTDLIEADSTVYPAPQNQSESQQSGHQHCKDCGLIVQRDSLPFCSSFREFPNAGIGIYLLFQCFKNIGILIALLGSIFSAYALHVNISQPSETLDFSNFATKLSYASIMKNLSTNSALQNNIILEGWLVVAIVVIWIVCLVIMNVLEIKNQEMVDQQTTTASDFTVMIENLPFSMTKQELQIEFDQYYKKAVEGNYLKTDQKQNQNKTQLMSFKIKKVSKGVPFYLLQNQKAAQRLQEIQEQTLQLKEKFAGWASEVQSEYRFSTTQKEERSVDYKKYTQLRKQREEIQGSKYNAFESKRISAQIKETVFFVTFEKSQSINLICQLNPQYLFAKIKYIISCCSSVLYFKLFTKKSYLDVIVTKAPQPEDIIWENIGIDFQTIACRKFLTFFVTLLLLGASFGSVYGLTLLQLSSNSSILNYGASVTITLINIIIGISIQKLTLYERNLTKTSRQISLAMKTILAQLINSILVPSFVNIYYQKNIYYDNGLVYDVFYLAVTNSLIPPILHLLNFGYLAGRFKAWYKKRAYPRLMLTQQQLNQCVQLPQFQLGYAYIYYLNLYYFTCFYVTMQPFVVAPALIGIILMYLIQKHRLLKRSRRPIPSTSLLADAMGQLVFFGPFVLSLGNMTWYNLVTDSTSNLSNFIFVSHITAISISAIFFFLPVDSILHAGCSAPDEEILDYGQCKGRLKSEYDRLNPATKQRGLKQYMKLIEDNKRNNKGKQAAKQNIFEPKQSQTIKEIDILNVTEQEILTQQDKDLVFAPKKQAFDFTDDSPIVDEYKEKQRRKYEPKSQRKTRKSHQLQPRAQLFNNVPLKLEGYHSSKPKNKVVGNPYYDLTF